MTQNDIFSIKKIEEKLREKVDLIPFSCYSIIVFYFYFALWQRIYSIFYNTLLNSVKKLFFKLSKEVSSFIYMD
jgi:hypothetical protein